MKPLRGLAFSVIAFMAAGGVMAQEAAFSAPAGPVLGVPGRDEAAITAETTQAATPNFMTEGVAPLIKGESFGQIETWVIPGDDQYDEEYVLRIPGVGVMIGLLYDENGKPIKIERAEQTKEQTDPQHSPARDEAIGLIKGLTAEALELSKKAQSGAEMTPVEQQRLISTIADSDALLRSIRAAGSEDEVRQVVERWKARTAPAQIPAPSGPQTETRPDPAAQIAPEPPKPSYPVTLPANLGGTPPTPTAAEPAPAVQPKGHADGQSAPGDVTLESFYNRMEKDAFWFSSGREDAPRVYLMIDPQCPICAKLVDAMRPDIEAGKIQLRVILTPVLSRLSLDLATDILTSPNPQQAVLDHARERLKGAIRAKGTFDNLPQEFKDRIGVNVGLMKEYKLPGVPVMVFKTAEGYDSMIGYDQGRPWEKAVK